MHLVRPRQVVVGKRERPLLLRLEHPPDAAALRFDQVQSNHGLPQEGIAVRVGRVLPNRRLDIAGQEPAGIGEHHPVRKLRDDDAPAPPVVLMGDRVVERLPQDPLVVLGNGHDGAGPVRQEHQRQVADPFQQAVRGEEEGRIQVFGSERLPVAVLEDPRDSIHRPRTEQATRLAPADQQHRRIGNRPSPEEPGRPQKSGVIPLGRGLGRRRMPGGEAAPRRRHGLGVEIVERGPVADLARPVPPGDLFRRIAATRESQPLRLRRKSRRRTQLPHHAPDSFGSDRPSATSRTSSLPVTTSAISLARYSFNNSISRRTPATATSKSVVARSRYEAIRTCSTFGGSSIAWFPMSLTETASYVDPVAEARSRS